MDLEKPTIPQHFLNVKPVVRIIYERLIKAAAGLGEFTQDPKKTSIHLNRRTAFAGVSTRKDGILLTVKATHDIDSPRVHRREQASANRWHLEVRLTSPDDVDGELTAWLREAYELSA